MRAVLDTNILISAFVFPGGAPEMVYRGALEGRYELVTSPPLLAELGRVLGDKFGWEGSVAEVAVTQIARVGTVVRPRERLAVIADDPADDRVLEAAIEGGAEVIVSGDRHLLRLGEWGGVQVVRAAHFVHRLGLGTKSTPG
ncbi:MAG TPA: putative toxin-antitoxin system toxin component, PIN family [Actinomycetota bacterium]|nr:putative toxin-antitoxin system toxin component, PIN family [Actinomycetota bacterium]